MQLLVVIVVLVVTVAFVVRWAVRTLRGKGCGCSCEGCPMSGGKECHCGEGCPKLPEIDVED